MIYKLAHVEDLRNLLLAEWPVVPLLQNHLAILDEEYGADRDIDEDDGGYILYAQRGTNPMELLTWWDYERRPCESVEQQGEYCFALYLLNNEYSVSLVMHKEDLPEILRKELED